MLLFRKETKKTTEDIKEFGKRGEDSAASFLCGKGYTIVARNVRINHFETDIIAKNDTTLVFAEVKTRKTYPDTYHRFGRPAKAVDHNKKIKLIAGAEAYIKKNSVEFQGLQPRIDVIEVYVDPKSDKYKVLKIVHMPNAVRGR